MAPSCCCFARRVPLARLPRSLATMVTASQAAFALDLALPGGVQLRVCCPRPSLYVDVPTLMAAFSRPPDVPSARRRRRRRGAPSDGHSDRVSIGPINRDAAGSADSAHGNREASSNTGASSAVENCQQALRSSWSASDCAGLGLTSHVINASSQTDLLPVLVPYYHPPASAA